MIKLVIADKNYSSWSLRSWLAAKQAGIPFMEVLIRLNTPKTRKEIFRHSPSGKLPCLIDGKTIVWDSLAICEYLAEKEHSLWPKDGSLRAEARAICAEMHSGFLPMRYDMPMDISACKSYGTRSVEVESDIRRIISIWENCCSRHADNGPFLFGHFTVADAMFAPVLWQFVTYDVELPQNSTAWLETMMSLPAMQEWKLGALAEIEGKSAD